MSFCSTLLKLFVISTAVISEHDTLMQLGSNDLYMYVTSCYYSCIASKDPGEIDPFCYFGTRVSDKILKYLDDNPSVTRKNESIKYLTKHMDKKAAMIAVIININERDLLMLAKLNKLKKNDHHANRAVHEYIKKSKDNAIRALGVAVKCDLSIFNAVLDLITVEYTEAEVDEMLDKIHSKSP